MTDRHMRQYESGRKNRRIGPRSVAVLLAAGLAVLPWTATPPRAVAQDVLVSAEWLAEHYDDDNLVLLHVGMDMGNGGDLPTEYIPGSRFLNYHDIAIETDLAIELPPLEQLTEVFRALGVNRDDRVVLYGSPGHMPARVFMTLDYLGHGDLTSVLDGGLVAWKARHGEVVASPEEPRVGDFEPRIRDDVLVTKGWIASRLDDSHVTLVDARPDIEYTGERTGRNLEPGHIPGAYNLYWPELLVSEEEPWLLPIDDVRKRYEEAGASSDGVVVSYCFIGMRASFTYLISRHLGYDSRFYDGSWNEWGADENLPKVTGQSRR